MEQLAAQINLGDLSGATVTARLLVGADELPGEALLEAAAMINLNDKALAITLWEEGTRRKPLSDRAVIIAVNLGFRLGLDDRMTDLLREMPRIAAEGQSGVTMAGIDDLVEVLKRQQERNAEVSRQYEAGEMPIHTFAQLAGWKLAVPYHLMLTQTARAESPLRHPALLARHGSREFEPQPALTAGRTIVDITALLLAEHIDILNAVEKHLGPLRISAWLPTSLTEQLQGVQPHQPEVDADREHTLRLVREGLIGVFQPPWPPLRRADQLGQQMGPEWCAALERVRQADGLLVDFFPLTANTNFKELVVLPEEERRRIVPLGHLLQALQLAGVLTADDLARCAARLSHDAALREDPPLDVPRGRFVFLDGILAEQLARGGVLDAVSAYCRLEIAQTSLAYLEAEVTSAGHRRDLAGWVQRLLDRVSRGMQAGRYVSFTHPMDPALEELVQSPDLRCLHDLFPREDEQNMAVWCDDRYVNRHRASTAGPVVSTMEVLTALRNVGALTDEEYFDKLMGLRRANVRYLPVTSGEILYHVRAARIDDEGVEETPPLATLRMSIAAALRETGKVQIPAGAQFDLNNCGELRWVFDLEAVIVEAVSELWKLDEPTVAAARCEWLVENLRFDAATIIDLYKPDAAAQFRTNPFVVGPVRMMIPGLGLPRIPLDGEKESRRKQYFRWWYTQIVGPALASNPEIEQLLSDEITRLLEPNPEKAAELGISHQDVVRLALLVHADLPKAMRRFTKLPRSVREAFGIPENMTTVRFGAHSFIPSEWWHAVEQAINGQEATVSDAGGSIHTLHPGARDEFGCCALTITSAADGESSPVSTGVNPLYLHDEAARRRFLSDHPEYFDLPSAERAEAINEIVQLPTATARVTRLKERRHGSAENAFRRLTEELRAASSFSLKEFFPDNLEAVARHLRLGVSIPADWDRAAQQLLLDEGQHAATLRLGTLPRRLPESLLQTWTTLGASDFATAINAFAAEAITPILKLHVFHLAAARASKDESYFAVATEARDALMASSTEFAGFALLLRWSFERLRQQAWPQPLHPSVSLAVVWNYTARVHNILLQAHSPAESVQGHAESLLADVPTLIEITNRDLYLDAASPRRTQWSTFLARGMGDVFRTLPPELRLRLLPEVGALAASMHPANEPRSTDVFSRLAAETSTRPNALASFLGGTWEDPLAAVFPAETIAGWVFNTPLRFAERCLGLVEQDMNDCAAWVALWNGIGDAPVHAVHTDQVRRLLNEVSLMELFKRHEQAALGAINFCCAQARFHGDVQTLAYLEEHLVQCAFHCHQAREKRQGMGVDNQAFGQIARRLCEAVYLLRAGGVGTSGRAPFCELAAKLVQVCPALGTQWRSLLGASVPPLPLELSAGMWNFFLCLRAAP